MCGTGPAIPLRAAQARRTMSLILNQPPTKRCAPCQIMAALEHEISSGIRHAVSARLAGRSPRSAGRVPVRGRASFPMIAAVRITRKEACAPPALSRRGAGARELGPGPDSVPGEISHSGSPRWARRDRKAGGRVSQTAWPGRAPCPAPLRHRGANSGTDSD